MQIFHDRNEALRQHRKERRVISLPDGIDRTVFLEKHIWDEYDFITGRKYGYAYYSDADMVDLATRNAAEVDCSFDHSLDQIVRLSAYALTGKQLW